MNIKTLHIHKPIVIPVDIDAYDTAQKLIDNWRKWQTIEANGWVFQNCHDQTDDTHLTIALHQLYPNDALKALEQLFLTSIIEPCSLFYRRSDQMVLEQYWDQRDSIDMQPIFENIQSDETLEQAVTQYVIENDYLDERLDFYHHWNQFIAQYPKYDLSEFESHLQNWFDENIDINFDIPQLIRNTGSASDLALYFGKARGEDLVSHEEWERFTRNTTLDQVSSEVLEDIVGQTLIAWLIKSQGYALIDLFDPEKYLESSFLTDVRDELFDYMDDLELLQLVAIPYSSDWHALFHMKQHKSGIIKAGTCFGLFDRVNGTGSGFGIRIERDIVLNNFEQLYDLTVGRYDEPYNYSPDYVYGFSVRSTNEQIEVSHE